MQIKDAIGGIICVLLAISFVPLLPLRHYFLLLELLIFLYGLGLVSFYLSQKEQVWMFALYIFLMYITLFSMSFIFSLGHYPIMGFPVEVWGNVANFLFYAITSTAMVMAIRLIWDD